MVTANFEIKFIRPLMKGRVRAIGNILKISDDEFISESTLYNEQGKIAATGTGIFAKSRTALNEVKFYA